MPETIRDRAARMVAMPSADGNHYDDFAQAVADRATLLTRVDALEALLRRLLEEYDEDVLRTPSFVTMDAVRALIGEATRPEDRVLAVEEAQRERDSVLDFGPLGTFQVPDTEVRAEPTQPPKRLTREQAAIIGAFTGRLAGPFQDMHEYIERKLGRPVMTSELGQKAVADEVREAAREDFLSLVAEDH